MKIVQSGEMERVFKIDHKGLKVVINLKKGGSSLLCFITMNDVVIGKFDIISLQSISKAYRRFVHKMPGHKKCFNNEDAFIDFFLRAGDKLLNEDYEREGKQSVRTLTPDARLFLLSPTILDNMDRIERRTTEDPLIDCEEELAVFNLVIVSCKTTKPITYEHTGPASSGKTFPAEHAMKGFPKEMTLIVATDTGTAPKYDWDYYDKENMEYVNVTGNKCIYFREKQDSINSVKFYKPMMSHDDTRLVHRVPQVDPITGERRTVKYVMDGIASFILLSVDHMDDEEMSTRTMKGSPSISKKKTEKIISETFKSDGLHRAWAPPIELETMKDAMYSLKRYRDINPFSDILSRIFPKDDMKRARDMNRLRGLIRASTILHQLQRCTEIIDDEDVLYSSLEDNLIGLGIMDKMLESTLLGIPETTLKIYEIMKDMYLHDIELTPNNIHEWCEIAGIRQTMKTLKDIHLTTLENHRFIKILKFGTKVKEREYSINERFENITKVPKLTPMFVNELQNSYQTVIDNYRGYFDDIKIPTCECPINCPNLPDDDKGVLKFLFGLNYFHDSLRGNVVYKIMKKQKKLVNLLYSENHPIFGKHIGTKKMHDIKVAKRIAEDQIKSGWSAKEWKYISEQDADKEYLKHQEEEDRKIREFCCS